MQTHPRTLPKRARSLRTALYALLLLLIAHTASASLTVLVGEPFGTFGTVMPNGHTAIYLDRACADGPLKLRMCQPGETPGVVIARYFHLGDHDWVAVPIMQFLYATDRPEDIPAYATPETIERMRERFRQTYLAPIVPEKSRNAKDLDEWRESTGTAYIRRLWGYQIDTTRQQDELFVAAIDARPNHRHYGVIKANCANFAADVVNFYQPGTVHANHLADLGILSPKQVAWRVAAYGKTHPEANLRVIEVPQIPGALPRSHPVRGGAEGFLKTKRYLATLLVIQPEALAGLLAVYLDAGRWKLGHNAEIVAPAMFEGPSETALSTR